MKKVIYICYDPLTARIERDWYIDYIMQKGINVEYWDCSSIFFRNADFPDRLKKTFVRTIKDYDHLESLLKQEDNLGASYIMLVIYEFRALKLYRLLARYNCRLYFIKWAVFPHKKRLVSKLMKLHVYPVRYAGRVLDKIFIMTTKKIGLKKPFEKVFYAGAAAFPGEEEALRNVPINMCDYDNFILSKNVPNDLPAGSYAVFLDVNLPFHPDLRFVNTDYIDSRKYFSSLNRFFRFVENKFGVEVVIAAHPSSNYQMDAFDGRKIIKHVTFVLARDAKFIISHHSASMNYAVLNKIPIIYIYTKEMDKLYSDSMMPIIKGSAEFLNASIYNVDIVSSADEIAFSGVDTERYDAYKYAFLTSRETENILSRDIFLKEITS
jgi:hypothetical protein